MVYEQYPPYDPHSYSLTYGLHFGFLVSYSLNIFKYILSENEYLLFSNVLMGKVFWEDPSKTTWLNFLFSQTMVMLWVYMFTVRVGLGKLAFLYCCFPRTSVSCKAKGELYKKNTRHFLGPLKVLPYLLLRTFISSWTNSSGN